MHCPSFIWKDPFLADVILWNQKEAALPNHHKVVFKVVIYIVIQCNVKSYLSKKKSKKGEPGYKW